MPCLDFNPGRPAHSMLLYQLMLIKIDVLQRNPGSVLLLLGRNVYK
jgi:hypothetical protein